MSALNAKNDIEYLKRELNEIVVKTNFIKDSPHSWGKQYFWYYILHQIMFLLDAVVIGFRSKSSVYRTCLYKEANVLDSCFNAESFSKPRVLNSPIGELSSKDGGNYREKYKQCLQNLKALKENESDWKEKYRREKESSPIEDPRILDIKIYLPLLLRCSDASKIIEIYLQENEFSDTILRNSGLFPIFLQEILAIEQSVPEATSSIFKSLGEYDFWEEKQKFFADFQLRHKGELRVDDISDFKENFDDTFFLLNEIYRYVLGQPPSILSGSSQLYTVVFAFGDEKKGIPSVHYLVPSSFLVEKLRGGFSLTDLKKVLLERFDADIGLAGYITQTGTQGYTPDVANDIRLAYPATLRGLESRFLGFSEDRGFKEVFEIPLIFEKREDYYFIKLMLQVFSDKGIPSDMRKKLFDSSQLFGLYAFTFQGLAKARTSQQLQRNWTMMFGGLSHRHRSTELESYERCKKIEKFLTSLQKELGAAILSQYQIQISDLSDCIDNIEKTKMAIKKNVKFFNFLNKYGKIITGQSITCEPYTFKKYEDFVSKIRETWEEVTSGKRHENIELNEDSEFQTFTIIEIDLLDYLFYLLLDNAYAHGDTSKSPKIGIYVNSDFEGVTIKFSNVIRYQVRDRASLSNEDIGCEQRNEGKYFQFGNIFTKWRCSKCSKKVLNDYFSEKCWQPGVSAGTGSGLGLFLVKNFTSDFYRGAALAEVDWQQFETDGKPPVVNFIIRIPFRENLCMR